MPSQANARESSSDRAGLFAWYIDDLGLVAPSSLTGPTVLIFRLDLDKTVSIT
jgi:hypothetical protein